MVSSSFILVLVYNCILSFFGALGGVGFAGAIVIIPINTGDVHWARTEGPDQVGAINKNHKSMTGFPYIQEAKKFVDSDFQSPKTCRKVRKFQR